MIWTQLPTELDVRTGIVGYPIYANFDVRPYFWRYWLLAGFIPLAAVAVYILFQRLTLGANAWRVPRARHLAGDPPQEAASPRQIAATGTARTLFVGAVFGLEAAIATSAESGWILSIGLPVVIGYAAVVSLAALAVRPLFGVAAPFWGRLALANAVATPFSVAGLYAVSRSTEITISATGQDREYSWMPAWLAAGLTVALLAWTVSSAARSRTGDRLRALERRLLLTVAGPVLLLLMLASLPGALGPIDMFHEGELLAGGRLTADGAFPWRDLITIHGLLGDVFAPLAALNIFEDSRWGFQAGHTVVLYPLYWLSIYYLCAYLFHRNWLFLAGTQAAIVLGAIEETHIRFILIPFILLLLGALLSKPTVVRAVAFTSALFVQAIVTPEAGVAVVAFLAALALFELYYFDSSRLLRQNFFRTFMFAGVGTLLSVVWFGFLAGFGALDDFFYLNLSLASDHHLTGGFPVAWPDDRFRFAAAAPVILVVLTILYFAFMTLRGRALSVADWVMGASAVFVGLYYHKFLARADEHVYQSFAVAVPLLFYVLYRFIEVGEHVLRSRWKLLAPIPVATAVGVSILLVAAPRSLAEVVRHAPMRLDATVSNEAGVPAAGFTIPADAYDDVVRNLDRIIDAYVGPEDAVLDFTNSPALFYYLLERPSPTRYYQMVIPLRPDTQNDLIEELAESRPKLVAFSSKSTGLPEWDGISNQVRLYRVSQYLFARYRPLLGWNGFVFWGLKGTKFPSVQAVAARLGGLPGTKNLHFEGLSCDWGYAPNFLAEQPTTDSLNRPLELQTSRAGQVVSVDGWAVDPGSVAPAAKVVATVRGKVVAEATPSAPRLDVVNHLRNPAYFRSGFSLEAVLRSSEVAPLRAIRIYALGRSGAATELSYTAGAAWATGRPRGPEFIQVGGRRVRVVPDAAAGFAESAAVSGQLMTLDIPRGARHNQYRWLEIESRTPLHDNGYVLTDRRNDPARQISFKTLDRGEAAVRVLVGACSQWYGYRSRRLHLRLDRNQPIAAVRLYR